METRIAIQLDFEDDEYNMVLPISFVSGFHRCPFRIGLDLPGMDWLLLLTCYPIIHPAEDTCPGATESWYRPDWMSPSDADSGERCWDLDYINDLDLIPIKGPDMHVPVLDPDFDSAETRAWLFLTVLRDSGFRLLDTVNRDGIPDIVDAYPVGAGFPWTTYDGGALLVAVQKRRLGIEATAVVSLLQYFLSQPQAAKQEEPPGFNIKDIVTNVRIFVGNPAGGGKVEIGLPEFLRMIGAQWNKAPAYSPPRSFIEDFPYLDLGEGSPVVFQVTADLAIPGMPAIPLSILAEAWAGYYLTNIYGVGSFFP